MRHHALLATEQTLVNAATSISSDTPLTDSQIHRVAPSVFADDADGKLSGRYAQIPTYRVLEALRNEGFQPFYAAQTKVRTGRDRTHTKHMLRLRHENLSRPKAVGDGFHEVLLMNSHDGSSMYQMLSAYFRLACLNGMVCGSNFAEARVRHSGDVKGRVVDAAFTVIEDSRRVEAAMDAFRAVELSRAEQEAFAHAALRLRWDSDDGHAPVTAEQLLETRRSFDKGPDLWTKLNVVQENLVRGGLEGVTRDGKDMTTKPVQGVNTSTALNRALWDLAEGLRKLKAQQGVAFDPVARALQ